MSESNTGYRPLPPLATSPTIDDVKRLYAQPVIEVWHPEYMQVVLEVLAATERERDEARDQANRLRGIYGDILSRAESLGWRRPTSAINSFQSVLSWMADNAERAKERDALRAECDDLHRTIDVLRAEMSEWRNEAHEGGAMKIDEARKIALEASRAAEEKWKASDAHENPRRTAYVVGLEREIHRLKVAIDEAYRVDGRLPPDYEHGWNDAVTHILKTISDGHTCRECFNDECRRELDKKELADPGCKHWQGYEDK